MDQSLPTTPQPTPVVTEPSNSVPPVPPVPQEPPLKTHNRKKILTVFVIILFVILGIISVWMFLKTPLSAENKQTRIDAALGVPSLTPMPFVDMTIPHLRERKYESRLGNMEAFQENGTYSSYVTSYTSDGLRVNALMTKPTGEMPSAGWPAIVFIHGYIPPTLYSTTERYDDYIDYFARNGFVVLKIDLRGHGTSEGQPGGGYYGSDYVVDALNAYAALQTTDFINPKAIGMWGHSMAGNIIMRSMAAKKDIPAAVIWAGAVYTYEDMRTYGIDDNSYRPPTNDMERQRRRRELFEKHGSPSATSPFWMQVAPTNYLSDISGAIQLHHAVDDDVVNIGYSRDLIALLDKTSVPHEIYEYPSGGHNLTGPSFTQAMQRSVEFFQKYLR